jgi:hypothetical protein
LWIAAASARALPGEASFLAAGFVTCDCTSDGSAGDTDDRFFDEEAGPLE